MRHTIKRLGVMVAALGVVTSAMAWEFRAPLSNERGPLRYFFKKRDPKKLSYSTWSMGHDRQAHKAFTNSGDTKTLSSVIFGSDEFRLNTIFPNAQVPIPTENYNPFMRILKIRPRITYEEKGVVIGGTIDFPVWKGRLGVRGSIPVRDIKIEREDQGERDDAHLQNLVVRGLGDVVFTDVDQVQKVIAVSDKRAYRFDLVEALPQNKNLQSMIDYRTGDVTGKVTLGDISVHEGISLATSSEPKMVVLASPEGLIPRNRVGIVIDFPATTGVNVKPSLTALPADLSQVDPTDSVNKFTFNAVNPAVEYRGNADDDNPDTLPTPAERCKLQDAKANLWFISVHKNNGLLVDKSNNAVSLIETALKAYDENVYEWMHDRGIKFNRGLGFDFDTSRLIGIGDIPLDVFYEHPFGKDLVGEFMLGIVLPTGIGSKYDYNPYKVHLGNGEHWQIKLGGMVAWRPADWINLKLDAQWSFVLEGTEHRAAAFKGAKTKNIGPSIKSNVSWGHLHARIDATIFHPKTRNFASTFGYEFYYKTEDNVSFRGVKSLASWLDRTKGVSDKAADSAQFDIPGQIHFSAADGTIVFGENLKELDSSLLEKHTDSIAHRLHWESSYRFSKWVEVVLGGASTFAGNNIAKEFDIHGGIHINFT